MATFKIYNDITTESEKKLAQFWGDAEGVCFKDVDEFCEAIGKEDTKIDLRLHCDGGSCLEGWAIYDRLRASGKEITATVEGNAASMATIILMAAPKERRCAYQNAQICIHNPFVMTSGLGEAARADDLQKMADDLRREQNRMVALYVERCDGSATAEEIQSLMDEDKYISAQRALDLGLIGRIIQPASASKKQNNFNNKKNLSHEMEEVKVKKSLLDKILGKLGFKSLSEVALGMDLNTADGQTLTVEREEGAPEVGDAATPDGTFVMPDGSTIIVENGAITEIKPAEEEAGTGEEEGNSKKGENDAGEEEKPAEEEAPADDEKVKELEQKVADLEARVAELEEQLGEANAKAKTSEDLKVLNAVKMAGGAEKVLAKISSSFKPKARAAVSKNVENEAAARNTLREKIDAIKNKK